MPISYEMLARCQEPQKVKHENNLRVTALGGLALSVVLTITACVFQGVERHWWRTGFLLLAVPALALSKRASDELTTEARGREDRQDITRQAFQDNLYKLLTQTVKAPDAPVVVEPPALGTIENPRTDWQPLFTELFAAKNSDNSFLYPAVFLTGRQGTGKTTFLKYIQHLLTGDVVVIDSHYKAGNWKGVTKVVGKAQDYADIEIYLTRVSEDVKSRYGLYAVREGIQFPPITIVAEEMTNWDGHIDKDVAKTFMKASLSDFRKVNYRLISVAHADTNTARGGAQGTAKMRANGEVRIELLEKGLALITMPGTDEPFYLAFPNLEHYTGVPQSPMPRQDRSSSLQANPVVPIAGTPTPVKDVFTAIDAIAVIADYLDRKSAGQPVPQSVLRKHSRKLKDMPDSSWTMLLEILASGELKTDKFKVSSDGNTYRFQLLDVDGQKINSFSEATNI